MTDDAFTWLNESPAAARTASAREPSPSKTRPGSRRQIESDGDTIDELRARLNKLQARLDMLEGSVDAWQTVAGWLPSSGARMLAAWRQRTPRGTRSQRFIRIMDVAGNHLADTSAVAPRLLGRGLRALAGTLRERVAA